MTEDLTSSQTPQTPTSHQALTADDHQQDSTRSDETESIEGVQLPHQVQSPKGKMKLNQEQVQGLKKKRLRQQKAGVWQTFKYHWQAPEKKLGFIALGVVSLGAIGLAIKSNQPDRIFLQGDETIAVKTEGENVINEEQAEFARQRALKKQGEGQAGIDLSTATKRVIRPSEFTEQDFKDTDRFKQITDGESNQVLFVDVTTNKKYDEKGNEVVDMPIEQPYYNPPPVSYSQFHQHENYIKYQEQQGSQQNQALLVGNDTVGQNVAEQNAQQPQYSYQAPPTPYSTYTTADGQQVAITHSTTLQNQIDRLNSQSQQHGNTMLSSMQRTQAIEQGIRQDLAQPKPINPLQAQAQSTIQNTVNRLNQSSAYGGFSYGVSYAQGSVGEFNNQLGGMNAVNAMPTPYNQGQLTTPAQSQVTLLPPHIIRQGTTWLVMIDQDVNSDKSSEVRGIILDGPYKGGVINGVLLPTGTRNLAGMVRFNSIEPKNPRQPVVALTAQALSLKGNSPDVTTSVKRHYAQNYGAIVLESVAQGYGDAYSNVGESTVVTDNGTVITTKSNKVDTAQIRGATIGALSQRLNTDLARLGNRPPTYKIEKGTIVKVRLTANLNILTGLVSDGTGASTGTSPNNTNMTTHTFHAPNQQ